MPGEFGEGTHTEGDKSASQEGEQGLYQPETMLNGGTGSSDPDQADIPAVLRERTTEDPDLAKFRSIADEIAEEVARSGGPPLSGNTLEPLLRGLQKAYQMGQGELSHGEAEDLRDSSGEPDNQEANTEKVKPKRLITKVMDAAGEALDGNLEGEDGDEA